MIRINTAWMDLLVAAVVIILLVAAFIWGDIQNIQDNFNCPERFQQYSGVVCTTATPHRG
jgi:hypothetical protein